MLFKNCTFFNESFEKELGDIEITDGKISRIGFLDSDGKDMSGKIIIPGFVDIHIHGAAGGDTSDGDSDALKKMSDGLAKNGVTSFCPTTMTLGHDRLINIAKAVSSCEVNGAKILGLNLEGPFISPAKKGAQNGDYVRAGSIEEFDELFEASNGKIKLITIAPEAFDSDDFISYAAKKCTVSVGHSAANATECQRAFDKGAKHVTHLYNAMTPMSHREAGIVGTALDNSSVLCELICDGGHICPAVLRNTFKILGEDRACVISDSMRAAGLGTGEFELGGQQVFVKQGGGYAVMEDGTIAASITNIYREFRNLLDFGIDFKTALKACTINPAKAVGEDGAVGSIAVGKYADLVALTNDLEISEVYINGTLA